MPPLTILVKPSSSNCNLRCKYCFYHSVAGIREVPSYGLMSLDMLEIIVKKSLEFADGICTFAFQGGEPTLVGLDFFKHLVSLQKKYNSKNVKVNNAIQTNGILINDAWAEFLAENNFLVGLSLDGPKDIHDALRYDANGDGTFIRVMNAVKLFNKHKTEYNILAVVNSYVARHVHKVYSFFKRNNFRYLQFIPCLDPLNERPGSFEYSLSPERYAYFLKNLFDLWYEDVINGNMISIRHFDNLVGMLMGYPPEMCGMSGVCNCQFVIEADGGVFPCDFYVIDEWYLGNIKDMGFEELKHSENGKKFVEASLFVDAKCKECKWFNLCRGGCRRHREPYMPMPPAEQPSLLVQPSLVLNYFCTSYSEFFEYAATRLWHLARYFSSTGR